MFGWFSKNSRAQTSVQPLYFHNTASGKRELFVPRGRVVRMYNCGPTVYDFQHIGNLSAAVFADTIRRVLECNGYTVKQVINITDFGHLTSDADEGDDKMLKGLKREKMRPTMKNMRVLADRYADAYMEDIKALGVAVEKIEFPRASDYIPSQIALIQTLEEKGYAYGTKDGIYFDTSKFSRYGELGSINVGELKEGARVEANPEKHAPADFALWKFNKDFGWDSPWGHGFPGWHIECSAMARALLGEQIDIHTGGIEHISIHHNNEIVQSEVATGKTPFARYWMHRAHIQIEGHKIAKSEGNTAYLTDIVAKNIHPLALRYWFLTAHYRTPANFTWDALSGSSTALMRLHRIAHDLPTSPPSAPPSPWQKKFHERINDDMDTPGAIAVMWDMLKEESLSPAEKHVTLLDFDRVLGLHLEAPLFDPVVVYRPSDSAISDEVRTLIEKREGAREAKDWSSADHLRDEIKTKGFEIEDTSFGPRLTKVTV